MWQSESMAAKVMMSKWYQPDVVRRRGRPKKQTLLGAEPESDWGCRDILSEVGKSKEFPAIDLTLDLCVLGSCVCSMMRPGAQYVSDRWACCATVCHSASRSLIMAPATTMRAPLPSHPIGPPKKLATIELIDAPRAAARPLKNRARGLAACCLAPAAAVAIATACRAPAPITLRDPVKPSTAERDRISTANQTPTTKSWMMPASMVLAGKIVSVEQS